MSYPKAILSQLTDLDDNELDEQAGVFNYTKRSAPASPKPFFNPAAVFLDIPDYRESVDASKRFTVNNLGLSDNESRAAPLITPEETGTPSDYPKSKFKKPAHSKPSQAQPSERSLEVETSQFVEGNNTPARVRPPSRNKNRTAVKNHRMSQLKPSFSNGKPGNPRSRNDTDSEEDPSPDHEEFMYRGGTPRASKPSSPSQEYRDYFSKRDDGYGDTEDSEGYYSSQHYNYYQPNYKQKLTNKKQHKSKNLNHSVPMGFPEQISQNPNTPLYFSNRRNPPKFSSDEASYKWAKYRSSHQPTLSFQPNNGYKVFQNQAFLNDWDSDDEQMPLFWNMPQRHGYTRYNHQRGILADLSISLLLFIIVIGSLTLAFFSVSTVPLSDLQIVNINGIIASEKDLTFNLHMKATNWNIFAITISEPILYIHATPIRLKTPSPTPEPTKEPEPTTTDVPEPTKTDDPEPTETKDPQPEPTTTEPKPTKTKEPEPTSTDEPKPTNTEKPEPTSTDEPKPTKTKDPEPTTTDEPKPTKTKVPQPTDTEEPMPTTPTKTTPPDSPTTTTSEPAPPTKTDASTTKHSLPIEPTPTTNPDHSSILPTIINPNVISSFNSNEESEFNQIFKFTIDGAPIPELLGEVRKLDTPLVFSGGLFNRGKEKSANALIRISIPSDNKDSNETSKWPSIMKGVYDLQVLGTIQYKMLFSSDAQTVCAIQRIKGSQVDPKSDLIICKQNE